MKRIAIYVRVSTRDSRQDTDNQLHQLREYASRRGWEIVEEYSDHESGRKGRGERGGFDTMFKDAGRRHFDLLLFWSLDRFSREGIAQVANYLQILTGHGVQFHSFQEEYLNTDSDMLRPLLIAIVSHFAAYEASRISERTKAGLERAKRQGKTLGRPVKRPNVSHTDLIAELHGQGMKPQSITLALNRQGWMVSESTVRRMIKQNTKTHDSSTDPISS